MGAELFPQPIEQDEKSEMRFLLSFLISLSITTAFCQLRSHTTKLADGGKMIVCKHVSGQKSTIECWDAANQFGQFIILSAKGDTLAHYFLRKVGGHASVQISYYPNGQVKQANFSDAPDGGIQFYHSTVKWDESGKQTERFEQEYPPRMLVVPSTVPGHTD